MHKILFDGIATQGRIDSPFSGGANYAIYVLEAALRHGYMFDIVLQKDLVTHPRVSEAIRSFNVKTYLVENRNEVCDILDNGQYSRFFSARPWRKKKTNTQDVVVIHGLRSVELPWDKYRYKYEKKVIRKFVYWIIGQSSFMIGILKKKHIVKDYAGLISGEKEIITVSAHTKYSLKYHYPSFDCSRLHVFPAPVSLKPYPPQESGYGRYLLMVNGNRYEKNTYRSILVLSNLFKKKLLPGLKVVITGGAKMAFKSEIPYLDRYILLDYVDETELKCLYQNAYIFLYPSLNEGYGYPPLIAMANGVPVAASSATSIPEVCRDGALFFNPYNLNDMANRILQLFYDVSCRNALIDRGYSVVRAIESERLCNEEKLLNIIFGPDVTGTNCYHG